jgi:hypothetical protein
MFNNFFFSKIVPFMRMWKNIVQPDRPQMTIWRLRIACWTPKATRTHSEYVTLIAFPLQQWLHDCASVLRYTNSGFLAFHVITYPTHGMSYPKMALVLITHVYGVLACTYFRLKVRVCTAVVRYHALNSRQLICLLMAGVSGLVDGTGSPVTGRGYSSLIWKQERLKYVHLFVFMYFEH